MDALKFTPLPAFQDNYLWLLSRGRRAVIVDPGDAQPVLSALQDRQLELEAVLITHHHPDHVAGLPALLRAHPVPVYGPKAEAANIPGLSHALQDGDRVHLETLDTPLAVWAIPGHTLGHIAYVAEGWVLCGDTLFSAGCGRLFEGTAAQLQQSLQRLAGLPDATRMYCTHEYTLANLAFAAAVEPDNAAVAEAQLRVRALRAQDLPSVPTTLAAERRFNPFLRTALPTVQAAAANHEGAPLDSEAAVFASLRRWKDRFRSSP